MPAAAVADRRHAVGRDDLGVHTRDGRRRFAFDANQTLERAPDRDAVRLADHAGSRLHAAQGEANLIRRLRTERVVDAGPDGLRAPHRHRSRRQRRDGRRLEHGRREGASENFFDEELRAGQSQADDFADAQRMAGTRLQLARADEGAVSTPRILDVPLPVIEEKPCVATGNRLGGVAFDEDGGRWITTDDSLGRVDSMGLFRALVEQFEVGH